jgi:transposase InsO family protein
MNEAREFHHATHGACDDNDICDDCNEPINRHRGFREHTVTSSAPSVKSEKSASTGRAAAKREPLKAEPTVKKQTPSNESDSEPSDDEPSDDDDVVHHSRERGGHLTNLVPFFERLFKLYPYEKFPQLYKDRQPIIKSTYRLSEYYRLAVELQFDKRLFPPSLIMIYRGWRTRLGLANVKPVREALADSQPPEMIMTYHHRDIANDEIDDIDLDEDCYTFAALPRAYVMISRRFISTPTPPLTFSGWCKQYLEAEKANMSVQFRNALEQYSRARDAKLGLQSDPPALEMPNGSVKYERVERQKPLAAGTTSKSRRQALSGDDKPSSSDDDSDNDDDDAIYRRKDRALKKAKNKEKSERERVAERHAIVGEVMSVLDSDSRLAVQAHIDEVIGRPPNRFVSKIKTPPTLPKPFSGVTREAAAFLQYILTAIVQYQLEIDETFMTIQANLTGSGMTWYRHNQSTIMAQPARSRLKTFIELFRRQYLSEQQATYYEEQLDKLKLESEDIIRVENHYTKFVETMTSWRACNHTVSDTTLVHRYFKSLPDNTKRTIGVEAVNTCRTVTEMYQKVRATALLIGRSSVNSIENDRNTRVNALTTHENKRGSRQSRHEPRRSRDRSSSVDKYSRDVKCFHCGDAGHRVATCSVMQAGKPQTPRGLALWADFQKRFSGRTPMQYNAQAFVRKARQRQESGGDEDQPISVDTDDESSSSSSYHSRSSDSNRDRDKQRRPARAAPDGASTSSSGSSNVRASSHDVRVDVYDEHDDMRDSTESDGEDIESLSLPVRTTTIGQTLIQDKAAIDSVDCEDIPEQSEVIYSNQLDTYASSDDDADDVHSIRKIAAEEKQHAHALCARLEMNERVQMALIDQGSTRNLMRRSWADREYPDVTRDNLPSGCVVISSTGQKIALKQHLKLRVRISDEDYCDTVFMLVEDTASRDICTDVILGRTFLARTGLCIDLATNRLFDATNTDKQYMSMEDGRMTREHRNGRRVSVVKPIHGSDTEHVRAHQQDVPAVVNTAVDSFSVVPVEPVERDVTSPMFAVDPALLYGDGVPPTPSEQTCATSSTPASRKIKALVAAVNNSKQHSRLMKEAMIEYVVQNSHLYTVRLVDDDQSELDEYAHSAHVETMTDTERVERIRTYLHAISEQMNSKQVDKEEQRILMDQLLELPFGGHTDVAEDDPIMQNVEDLSALSAPSYKDDKNIKQAKLDMIYKMTHEMPHLTTKQQDQLCAEIMDYEQVYSLQGENFKQTDAVQHEIHTEPGARAFRQKLRTYSPPLQKILDTEVNKLLEDGVVVPSTSPYASNLLLVRKPDPTAEGGIKNRVCVNFIQLNKQTIKDSYPLPNQLDIFNKIGRSSLFTTMDLMSGYWQVMIKPEHRHKTAFITSRGLYEFVVMAFGLCNAPGTFQRLMDEVIRPEYRDFIQTYIDDIIIHSSTFDDHIKHLRTLHQVLLKHKLTVKLTKCKFAQTSVKFLGHIVSQGQIQPNPEKVSAIDRWQRPKDVTGVRSFLGCVGWYRRFIDHFAEKAHPLFQLTKKNARFEWTDECQRSFDILKKALMTEPILVAPDNTKDFVLETDASDIAIGAALKQVADDGFLHPVAYASKTLNGAQTRYQVSEREALAIPWALAHFRTILEGHKYTCLTDHRALKYLIDNKESTNSRLTRWVLQLQPYHLKIEYIKGKDNVTADLLSRADKYMVNSNAMHTRSQRRSSTQTSDTETHEASAQSQAPAANSGASDTQSLKRRGRRRDIQTSDVVGQDSKVMHKHSKRRQRSRSSRDAEYDVEEVLGKRKVKGKYNRDEYEYEVKWLGYDLTDPDATSWESLDHLRNAMDKVVAYEQRQRQQSANQTSGAASIESMMCEHCEYKAPNQCAMHVHRHHVHNVPIPSIETEYDVIRDVSPTLIREYQQNDKTLSFIYDSMTSGDISPHLTSVERRDLNTHEFVRDEHGVLYCMDLPTLNSRVQTRQRMRLVVPQQLRRKLIRAVHEGALTAHPGIIHTCSLLVECAYWPRMRHDAVRHVLSCKVCQQAKRKKSQNILTRPVSIASRPFQHIGVDIVGPLPTTRRGNVYILTIVDHFTRWAEAIALEEQTTRSIARAIIQHVICRHGLFETMTSDNGSVFVSELADVIYKELGIKRVRTTPLHPQSNGLPERFNGTLKTTLLMWCNEEQDNWDELLAYAVFAYNTAFHVLIQEKPFYLINGRDPLLPMDVIINRQHDEYDDIHHYAYELTQKLRQVHERVLEIYKQVNEERQTLLDESTEKSFKIGDKVWLYDPTTKVGMARKLTLRWKGPCDVLERKSDNTYRIAYKGESHLINRDRLRLYVSAQQEQDGYLETELQQVEAELKQLNDFELELQAKKQAAQRQHELVKAHQQVSSVSDNAQQSLPHATRIDADTDNDIATHAHGLTVGMQF